MTILAGQNQRETLSKHILAMNENTYVKRKCIITMNFFLKYAVKLRSDKYGTNQMSQFVFKRRDFKSNGRNFLNRCNQ